MHLWLVPMIYVGASVVCGLTLPRIEHSYMASYTFNLSTASAQACLSAAASGMMALTGVVFAMAFVMVQFSAIAYSPRLVLWFARDRVLLLQILSHCVGTRSDYCSVCHADQCRSQSTQDLDGACTELADFIESEHQVIVPSRHRHNETQHATSGSYH
jgi:hypothetical protein